MATQKRRVIYLSDEAWDAAKRQAEPFMLSASAYIQSLILGGRIIPSILRDEMERLAQPMTQGDKDAILRRVNRKTGE